MKKNQSQHSLSRGEPLQTIIAAYLKLACFTVFVCSDYSQALGVTISLHLRNKSQVGETAKKLKMSQLIIQNYELSLTLTLLRHNLHHIVLQVNQSKTQSLIILSGIHTKAVLELYAL